LRDGWLGDLYRITTDDALLRYAKHHALDRAPTAEDDVSRNGPVRSYVASVFRDGIHGASTLASLSRSIDSILASTLLDAMFETVQPEGAKFGSFDLPTPGVFLGGVVPAAGEREVLTPRMWTADGQVGSAREVVSSYVWWPGEWLGTPLLENVKVLGSDVVAALGEPFRVVAARLDLTAACPADVLLAFPRNSTATEHARSYAASDETVL
jgi:hypothetical protein